MVNTHRTYDPLKTKQERERAQHQLQELNFEDQSHWKIQEKNPLLHRPNGIAFSDEDKRGPFADIIELTFRDNEHIDEEMVVDSSGLTLQVSFITSAKSHSLSKKQKYSSAQKHCKDVDKSWRLPNCKPQINKRNNLLHKNNKTPGRDNIINELLKNVGKKQITETTPKFRGIKCKHFPNIWK